MLVGQGASRCGAHVRQQRRDYDRHQRPARHKFYSSPEARKVSKEILEEQPICECGARTTQADHNLSLRERPDLALDKRNLVRLCGPCHSRKTAKENSRWGRRNDRVVIEVEDGLKRTLGKRVI